MPLWSPLAPVDHVNKRRLVPWIRAINFLSLLAIFITNALANILPIAGRNTGDVSRQYPTFITPAGYAFSIWGVIYFALAVWGVYQLLPRSYSNLAINEAIGYLFPFNALFNVCWLLAFHYEQMWLAAILLLHLLATLAVMYGRLAHYDAGSKSWQEWAAVDCGFALYYAWVLVAAFINLYVVSTNVTDESFVAAGQFGVGLVGLLQLWVAGVRMDPLVSVVGCWAITAIAVAQKQEKYGSDRVYGTAVGVAAVLGAETAVLAVVNHLIRRGAINQRASALEETDGDQ